MVLSKREGEPIKLLSHGLKNKEIAFTLQITEGTVKVYLSRLFQKVGVKDRFQLALFGLKNLTAGHAQPSEKLSRLDNAHITHLRSPVLDRPAARPPTARTEEQRSRRESPDRFGTSAGESLRQHFDHLCVRRRQEAEERAAKVGVKLVFPIFFILPAMMLACAGRASLEL